MPTDVTRTALPSVALARVCINALQITFLVGCQAARNTNAAICAHRAPSFSGQAGDSNPRMSLEIAQLCNYMKEKESAIPDLTAVSPGLSPTSDASSSITAKKALLLCIEAPKALQVFIRRQHCSHMRQADDLRSTCLVAAPKSPQGSAHSNSLILSAAGAISRHVTFL